MRTDHKNNKREVTKVNMTKISAVGRPAQEDAIARLLKTATNGGDNTNKETEMSEKVDFAAVTKNAVGELEKELGDKYDVVAASVQTVLEKQAEFHTKDIAAMGEKMADLEKMATMTDAEKAYMGGLDDKKKKEFMLMDAMNRKKIMDKMAKEEEVIEYEGQTMKKSQTDSVTFNLFKSIIKKNEDLEKSQKLEKEKAEKAEFMVKAKSEFSHLPLAPEVVADMLKSIEPLPEDVKTNLTNLMKAENTKLENAKKELGTTETADTVTAWDNLVKSKMAEAGNDKAKAMELAAATPEGEALYNEM
jgi:hypothetical protein